MKRIISLTLTAVFIVSAAEAADPTVQMVPVFKAMGGPPNFAVGKRVGGASATVYRNDDGVGVIINTKKLSAGGAFTAWLFECSSGVLVPCVPHPPNLCSADTAGPNGKVHLACGLSDDESFAGLPDSRAPFVVLILDHGPIDPADIHNQLSIPPGGAPVQTVKVD